MKYDLVEKNVEQIIKQISDACALQNLKQKKEKSQYIEYQNQP